MYEVYLGQNLICSSKIEELCIINPIVDMEINKAGTFSFILPPNHPYYDSIQRKQGLIKVLRDTEQIFEGTCSEIQIDFYKQKKITCEGELSFLNDSIIRPSRKQGQTARQLLESYISEHNSLVETDKQFTVGQVTVNDDYISCYTDYQSTMQEIKEDLVDDLGGYLRVRHSEGVRYLDYLAESPRTNSQVIRLGQNLMDLSQSIDTDDLATVIIPLGATLDTSTIEGLDERLTIKTASADDYHPANADYVYSETAVETFGWIEKVVEWNDVTTVAALLQKGEQYLSDTQFENLVIEAKAIDLGVSTEQFKVLDMIRVVSEPHGLDRYFMISKLQINLNNPERDTVTLGIKTQVSMTAKTQGANAQILNRIEQLPTPNMVQSAIDNATALITGSEGGYVVIVRNADGQPIEIKIQDALNNPTKIWRWNQNGFGYSSDGGVTYGTAITMNGAIVADYITSGTMSAARIRGGELLVGGSGLAANGSIIVKDANDNIIATINNGGIDLKKGTIKGPSVELGGSNNTNGTLIVKDASGNVIVTLDRTGVKVDKGSIQGSYIKLGGSEDGWIDIRDANDVRVGQLTKNTFMFIDNSVVRVQITPTSLAVFNDVVYSSGNHGTTLFADKEEVILNSEYLRVGTNSTAVYTAPNNLGPFILPTQLSSDGRVLAALQGVVFVNGILVS